MKRAPFLGAAGAALLTGCGGRHVMQALPGVATTSTSSSPKQGTYHGRLVPEKADPIPDTVLKNPIIGEARRFDGATAPANWMFAQGQSLPVSGNGPLFGVLGTIAGGDGKRVFKLPDPGFGVIIAVGGSSITTPAMLRASGRHMTELDSLGPSAMRAPLRVAKPPSAELVASRKLQTSAVRVGRSSPVSVPPQLVATFQQARTDARTAAIEQLGPSSRARLDAAVAAAVAGRISVYGAVSAMISTLTRAEADALLGVNDAMIRPFNDRAGRTQSQYPEIDAAHFLISVAITREQARAIYRMERNR